MTKVPFPTEDMALTTILVVSDMAKSKDFYQNILGAEIYREYGGDSCVIQFLRNWILLVTSGGETKDKPNTQFVPPKNPNDISHSFTIRVKDCMGCYETLKERGAKFLTPPVDWGAEIRAFLAIQTGTFSKSARLEMRISIIIPTLNEERYLKNTILHTLKNAKIPSNLEIIVVDAGSKDGTLESIRDLGVKTFSRSEFALKKFASLNFGITSATGEIVLFLDADTLLPERFDDHVTQVIQKQGVVGGAFEFSFDRPDWKLQLITVINRIRYRFGKVFYGDQAVFAFRETLMNIGGVPHEPLMETAYLCKALRREGKLKIVKPGLKTSPRRFKSHGFFKVAWFDINMFIRFNLGLPVSNYAGAYWGKNLRASK